MATLRLPGPVCRYMGAFQIDAGTLCRGASPVPGPAGQASSKPTAKRSAAETRAGTSQTYSEHRGAVKNPLDYAGDDLIGNGQCAKLVQKLASAPQTANWTPNGIVDNGWKRGTDLSPSNVSQMEIGTPIASGWNGEGFYPRNSTGQHSGIFGGPILDAGGSVIGFLIVEQYSSLTAIKKRQVFFDPAAHHYKNDYFHRGGDYSTIKW